VTRRFKTGEMLRLDGNTGELRRVRRDPAAGSAGRPQ
jgi:hypothetical protein